MRLIDADALIEKCGGWYVDECTESGFIGTLENLLATEPTIQPQSTTGQLNDGARSTAQSTDLIDRQAVIDAVEKNACNTQRIMDAVNNLPSAQPERTCINCGRTANNGGWYADGGTRCPIEEHYALPKDGFCHLWEERNITDDDYPERREE